MRIRVLTSCVRPTALPRLSLRLQDVRHCVLPLPAVLASQAQPDEDMQCAYGSDQEVSLYCSAQDGLHCAMDIDIQHSDGHCVVQPRYVQVQSVYGMGLAKRPADQVGLCAHGRHRLHVTRYHTCFLSSCLRPLLPC